MSKATVNGVPAVIYDFTDNSNIALVKYPDYPNLFPVLCSLIEVSCDGD